MLSGKELDTVGKGVAAFAVKRVPQNAVASWLGSRKWRIVCLKTEYLD